MGLCRVPSLVWYSIIEFPSHESGFTNLRLQPPHIFFFSYLCISSSELSSRSTHICPILVRQMWDTCCYLPFSSLVVCLHSEFQFGVSGAILYLIDKFSTSHHTIKGGMDTRSLFFVWLQILIFDVVSFSSTLFFPQKRKSYYAVC